MTTISDTDVLLITLCGELELGQALVEQIRRGEIGPESAFGCLYGTVRAFSPWATTDVLRSLNDGVWCFDESLTGPRMAGDLAWFQVGADAVRPSGVSLPLLVHAGARSVDQLGHWEFGGLRVYCPRAIPTVDAFAIQECLDQFRIATSLRVPKEVEVTVRHSTSHAQWAEGLEAWAEYTSIEPFVLSEIRGTTRHEERAGTVAGDFTSRYQSSAVFSVPQWSPDSAVLLLQLIREATRRILRDDAVEVDIMRV
jgi:hypothetical protein